MKNAAKLFRTSFLWALACVFALFGALCAPASAAGADRFPAVVPYPDAGFADVAEGIWYADAVKLCYETGLMKGTADGIFSPGGTFTVAEAATVAARTGSILSGDGASFDAAPGEPWYQPYVSYLTKQGVPVPAPAKNATRAEFFALLSRVVPQSDLPAINSIKSLPDTKDEAVLRFYNAGILTGTDVYGSFSGERSLTRSEVATMLARVADPALRQTFTPQKAPADTPVPDEKPTPSYEEEFLQTEAVRVNGASVPFSRYLEVLNKCVHETDLALQRNTGQGLDWNTVYDDVDDLPRYFKRQATNQLVKETLVAAQARALGCDPEDLPAVLTPDPSKDTIYYVKHILVQDEQTAKDIITRLRTDTSVDGFVLFDRLMKEKSLDPDLAAYPDGYLFTNGEMVAEFENAVKALGINKCTPVPVKTTYGYHVILRLDPTSLTGWQVQWQQHKYLDYVEDWMNAATVTTNDAELDRLDVPARYAAYLASLDG